MPVRSPFCSDLIKCCSSMIEMNINPKHLSGMPIHVHNIPGLIDVLINIWSTLPYCANKKLCSWTNTLFQNHRVWGKRFLFSLSLSLNSPFLLSSQLSRWTCAEMLDMLVSFICFFLFLLCVLCYGSLQNITVLKNYLWLSLTSRSYLLKPLQKWNPTHT